MTEEEDDQDFVASLLASVPPPRFPRTSWRGVNARIDETAGWFGLADFRLWTLGSRRRQRRWRSSRCCGPAVAASATTDGVDVAHRGDQRIVQPRVWSDWQQETSAATRCSTRRCSRPPEALVSDSRARIWFALFVLAVFCLGGAGGFLLGRQCRRRRRRPASPAAADPGVAARPRRSRRPAAAGARRSPIASPSELQLDAAQQEQVRKILDEHRDRLDTVHREARERFDKEQRDLLAAIRAVLRPDQQTRFDTFLDRRR